MEKTKLLRIIKAFLLLVMANIGYAECITQNLKPLEEKEPQLLIFVSFSMPEQSLKLWAKQATKVNGKLLLRGFFKDTMQNTTEETLRIFKAPKVDLLIHPEAFEKFNIQKVPAVVIAAPDHCLEAECPAPQFDVVYGDTSLEDALTRIAAQGEHKEIAQNLLKAYRQKNG